MSSRVTFTQINTSVQNNIQKNYQRMSRLQEQLSSGQRIQRPSDAPVDVTNDLQLRSDLQHLEQFDRNLDDGKAYLSIVESTLSSTNNLYQRVRELAIQASNDTNTETEREYILREVRVLTDQLVSISNTSFKGAFVFSGTQIKTPPFEIREGTEAIDSNDLTATNNTDTFLSPTDTLPKTINIWDRSYQNAETSTGNPRVKDIIADTLQIPGLREGSDYTVDYVKGNITFLASATTFIPGVGNLTSAQIQAADPLAFPTWPPVGDPSWGAATNQPQPGGGIQMKYEWVKRTELDLDGKVMRELESGLVSQINSTASEVFGSDTQLTTWDAITNLMQGLHLNKSDQIKQSISDLNTVFERSLSAQATAGARTHRFDTTAERNEKAYIETTRLHSEIEDVDFAKVISDFTMQEAVYTASLQSAARVIQPTLANFL